MSSRKWTIAVLCAFLAGGILALVILPSDQPSTQGTDTAMAELREEIKTLSERVASLDKQVQEEVKRIRVSVKKSVDALPPDGVAAGLNAELSGFGRVEGSPGGVDKP